jgi:hypothetical protein
MNNKDLQSLSEAYQSISDKLKALKGFSQNTTKRVAEESNRESKVIMNIVNQAVPHLSSYIKFDWIDEHYFGIGIDQRIKVKAKDLINISNALDEYGYKNELYTEPRNPVMGKRTYHWEYRVEEPIKDDTLFPPEE